MEIIVESRGMKASDILDMAFDAGLQSPKIVTAGEWDGGRTHIITYGPPAYRKILEIKGPARKSEVVAALGAAMSPEPLPIAPKQAAEPVSQVQTPEMPKPKKRASKAAH